MPNHWISFTRRSPLALVVTVALTLATAMRAQAQGNHPADAHTHTHTHSAPHGGDIVEVSEHHIEFKADSSGMVQVWLLDAKEQPIAPPAGATVSLMGSNGSHVTVPLEVDRGAERLIGKFDPQRFKAFQAVVTLQVAGARHNLRFRYPSRH